MSDVSYDSITKSKKDRQRDRETERQRDRETERQRDRETETQKDRKAERQKYTQMTVNVQTDRQSIYIKNQIRSELIVYRQFLQKDYLSSDLRESNWNVRPL